MNKITCKKKKNIFFAPLNIFYFEFYHYHVPDSPHSYRQSKSIIIVTHHLSSGNIGVLFLEFKLMFTHRCLKRKYMGVSFAVTRVF